MCGTQFFSVDLNLRNSLLHVHRNAVRRRHGSVSLSGEKHGKPTLAEICLRVICAFGKKFNVPRRIIPGYAKPLGIADIDDLAPADHILYVGINIVCLKSALGARYGVALRDIHVCGVGNVVSPQCRAAVDPGKKCENLRKIRIDRIVFSAV